MRSSEKLTTAETDNSTVVSNVLLAILGLVAADETGGQPKLILGIRSQVIFHSPKVKTEVPIWSN